MTDLPSIRARAASILGQPPEGDPAYSAPAEDDDGDWFTTIHGAGDFVCRLGEPEDRNWCRDGAPVIQRLNDLHRLACDLLAALPASPPALTVGAALADPRVQAGTHVVECHPAPSWWLQIRIDAASFAMRTIGGAAWTYWGMCSVISDPSHLALPCRLVALADADADPASRGAL